MQVELIKANKFYSGLSISEDACKEIVADFKDEIPVIFAGTKLIMGKITAVTYNEETKSIFGEVDLEVMITAGIDGTKAIECPDGKIIVAGILRQGVLAPKSLMPGGKDGMVK